MDTNIEHRHSKTEDDYHIHFSSAQDWAQYALELAERAANGTLKDLHSKRLVSERIKSEIYDNMQDNKQYDDWRNFKNGTDNHKAIMDRTCDKDIREKVNSVTTNLPPLSSGFAPIVEQQFYHSDVGYFMDFAAEAAGVDDCMLNIDDLPIQRPIINIAVNFGALANAKPEQFINRGASLIAAVHALERVNVSVGVVGYSSARCYTFNKGFQSIVIKRPQDSLDETTLINMLTDYSAFRTIDFTIRHYITASMLAGSTRSATSEDFKLSYANTDNLVILPYDNMRVYNSPTSALEWTLKHIKEQVDIDL